MYSKSMKFVFSRFFIYAVAVLFIFIISVFPLTGTPPPTSPPTQAPTPSPTSLPTQAPTPSPTAQPTQIPDETIWIDKWDIVPPGWIIINENATQYEILNIEYCPCGTVRQMLKVQSEAPYGWVITDEDLTHYEITCIMNCPCETAFWILKGHSEVPFGWVITFETDTHYEITKL